MYQSTAVRSFLFEISHHHITTTIIQLNTYNYGIVIMKIQDTSTIINDIIPIY